MIKLSAVIITFNEEKNIARCLDSVKEVADDILVVDSFSTDKTELICKEKNVRFILHSFEGYKQQKNWAIMQAKYPHILSLDADEALSDELKQSIVSVKNNWHYEGYVMNRLTNYCGKWIYHCGWYPDKKLRLFDSRKGKWGGGEVHEIYLLHEKNSKAGFLKGDILHYSYYSIEEHRRQSQKYADISARFLHGRGRKVSFSMIWLKAGFKFVRNYFFKMGFLDGRLGWIICKITAHETYLKYLTLYRLSTSIRARTTSKV
jgi:glycosyltransferase involved in cell wall biosynthesis